MRQVGERESLYRLRALDELRFSHGDQWEDSYRQLRESGPDPRLCLTINRTEAMILQEINAFRQNRPAIRVRATTNADKGLETAQIIAGIIKRIEQENNADIVYETAVDHQFRIGRGWYRIILEFADEMSFDLVPKLQRVRDWNSVYLDPLCLEPDGAGAQWGFVVQDMSHEEFKRQYPNKAVVDYAPLAQDTRFQGWVTTETVRVAEYFYVEKTKEKIVQLSDGSVFKHSELPEGTAFVQERQATFEQIWHVKLSGAEVLDEPWAWPGADIPIIPVIGVEEDVNGMIAYKGMTHNLIDPQRIFNFEATIEVETVALAPRAPWVAAEGSFQGHELEWRDANISNAPYLEHAIVMTPDGQGVMPPPRREVAEPPIQALALLRAQAAEDMRAVSGVHQPTMGELPQGRLPESGEALRRLQHRGDITNAHFPGNAHRSIRQGGRILLDLITKLYTHKRVVSIIGLDDKEDIVTINEEFTNKDGQKKFFDLSASTFEATIDTGPSLATQRQDSADSLIKITSAYPESGPVLADITVRNLDFPDAQEASDRLRRLVPVQALGTDDEPSPQQLAAQVQQQQQQLQQLNAYAEEREQESKQLRTQAQSLQLALDDKTRDHTIELSKLELQRDQLAQKTATDNRKLDIEAQTKERSLDIDEAELVLDAAQGG
jgi:hypothetical protein